jgi:hypothetical protein
MPAPGNGSPCFQIVLRFCENVRRAENLRIQTIYRIGTNTLVFTINDSSSISGRSNYLSAIDFSRKKTGRAAAIGPVILTNGAVVHRYESLRVDEDIYTVALALAQCERISIAEAINRLVRSSGSLFVSPRFETEIGDPCEFALV